MGPVTSPRWAVDVKGTRWYAHPGKHNLEPRWRGVTGVIAALPKEAIPRWAAKSVATYAVERLVDWRELPAYEAVDLLKRVPWQERDRAAARGSEIHSIIEKMINGVPFEVERAIEGWVDAAGRFVEQVRPEPALMETTVFNEKHFTAGTFDYRGRLRAFPELGDCLIDWKTGRGVYNDMAVQIVGGYALGADYYINSAGVEIEWKPPDSAAIVHLTDKGFKIYPIPMHHGFRRAFLAALEIRKWEEEGPKLGSVLEVRARLDELPGEPSLNLVWLQQKVAGLSTARKLEVSLQCRELGIPTKASQMTHEDIEKVIALINLYEMTEEEQS